MKKVPEVGDTIILKEFCYTNKFGGTGMSDCNWDEKYTDTIKVKVIREWYDEETGQRGWGIPDPEDKNLLEYLERNACKGIDISLIPILVPFNSRDEYIIFWSEWDIVDVISN